MGWKRQRRGRRIRADWRRTPLAGPPPPRGLYLRHTRWFPPTRQSAGERLARVVCGDREMVDDTALQDIATALARAQVGTVARALERILARWPAIGAAVVTGVGDFIAAEAAGAVNLRIVRLSDSLGDAARAAPAAAVAWLLRLSHESAT